MGVTEHLAELVVRARKHDLTVGTIELSRWAMMDGGATTLAGRVRPAGRVIGDSDLEIGGLRDRAPQRPPNAACLRRICQWNDG
jgi:hypothetical protein